MYRITAIALKPTRWPNCSLACLALASTTLTGLSQGHFPPPGSLTLLQADGADTLHTQSFTLNLPQQTQFPVELKFGFETDELFGPGQIFDSFTLTLQTPDNLLTTILATADASGVVFAPGVLGPAGLTEASILRQAIASPSLNPNLAHQFSFSVQAFLPDSWAGKSATLYLDLFDNNNGILSQGWLSDLVIVPEPSLWQILPVAGVVLLSRRSRKCK